MMGKATTTKKKTKQKAATTNKKREREALSLSKTSLIAFAQKGVLTL